MFLWLKAFILVSGRHNHNKYFIEAKGFCLGVGCLPAEASAQAGAPLAQL
jgi:hypothetical protein